MNIAFDYRVGNSRRQRYSSTSSRCTVGTGRHNDLCVKARRLDREHAELTWTPAGLYVRDLGSRSGTWVNHLRVDEHGPLVLADIVTLGDLCLYPESIVSSRSVAVTGQIESTLTAELSTFSPDVSSTDSGSCRPCTPTLGTELNPALDEWSQRIHEQLLQQMDLRRYDVKGLSDDELSIEVRRIVGTIVDAERQQLPADLPISLLIDRVLDEALGLGPLEPLLGNDSVSEIMVNNHREIFVEREGRIERYPACFSNERTVYSVIERIITPLGRRIDEASPIVDARLKDGSRVNAVIPPLAIKGPSLTIRKFPSRRLDFHDLLRTQSLNDTMLAFLDVAIRLRRNIIVSGGTGTGKTTLLNILSGAIAENERIVTIEDAAELKLAQPNLVSLEARPANLEGQGAIPIRDLVRNALRMRPDRIVVGECRGGEAIDMLQAMNTGHDGSLTTLHANSPRDAISRLEVLVLMAGMDIPLQAIREQIASAVDIVIQQARFSCGRRRITAITEVTGVESGTVQLQDLFVFEQRGFDELGRTCGQFRATGCVPSFYEQLRATGHDLPLDAFAASEE